LYDDFFLNKILILKDDEDIVIEPCDDDNIMNYVNLLKPKVLTAKIGEWAKRSKFSFDPTGVHFGDEHARFSASSDAGNHSIGANFGGKNFSVGFGKGGFNFKSPWN
jgi:hypothetical protein